MKRPDGQWSVLLVNRDASHSRSVRVRFHGDRDKGIRTLQQVAEKGHNNSIDAKVFLCAIYRREEKWRAAAPILEDLIARFPRNYLLRFEQSQMYSATGEKDKAIATMQKVVELKKSGAI